MKMGRIEKLLVNSRWQSERVSRHAERMLVYLQAHPGERYLDVGCGNGAAALHVARVFGLQVTGIDVDPEQIRAAEQAGRGAPNVRFLTVDGTRMPFADGTFDIAATYKVTHHIPGWEEAFAEMLRVLRPCGHLLYDDFVFPEWVGACGKRMTQSMGFPTVGALRALVRKHGLIEVHRRRVLLDYEAVWRKSGDGGDEPAGDKGAFEAVICAGVAHQRQ